MKMKNAFVLWATVGLAFSMPVLLVSSESERGVNIGASLGGLALHRGEIAYRWAGEVGYQFSERFGATLEIAYAQYEHEWETESPSATLHGTAVDRMIPVTLSLLYRTSLGQGGEVYSGLGLGQYFLKESNRSRSESTYQGVNESETEWSDSALAPHICLGLEGGIRGGLRFFGEVRYVVGAVSTEKTDAYQTVKSDLSFGGVQVKCGLRLSFR